MLGAYDTQVEVFPSSATLFQLFLLFYSNYPLHFSVVRIYFHLKMVVRPKHGADNLNKIVKTIEMELR
jgi:hypothetical protein